MIEVVIVAVLAGLLLAGCNSILGSFAPGDAAEFTPPASYRAMWDSAQACTGRRGDFAKLRFYVVPGREVDPAATARTKPWALIAAGGATIVIAEDYRLHPMVVKHEMIHALGVGFDGPPHPAHPFVDPCHATWRSFDYSTPDLTP